MKHQKLETSPEISRRMAKMSKKTSKVERQLAKALWHEGYRYRLNYKALPGCPDIVITKFHIAIFVDGEFWHGKDFDKEKCEIKNNRSFWIEKIEENIKRDRKNDSLLKHDGWIVLHFWSNDVKKNLVGCIEEIKDFIEYESEGMKYE